MRADYIVAGAVSLVGLANIVTATMFDRPRTIVVLAPAIGGDADCNLASIQPDRSVKLDWECIDRASGRFRMEAPSMYGSMALALKAAKDQRSER
ncbi:hypothetical protein IC762_17715 [Bradyrhizobium genosp. L]|uniref:hypothetical protein n=1 Tax=Bradyrhizobium genosp. L TaxID=83637 RepID=UPI0018A27981|nr:hypothetical protein [Bradyrhizobium genosp. L]QPF81663.1 hypothetical protein IC762_17715 [Bradyrhizobium genosp. L]